MERPLEIAFHGLDASPAVEADIRAHVDKLSRRFPRLIGCRVVVEQLHRQHRTGNAWDVHIVLKVPGKELAVSREPGGRHGPDPSELNPVINAAFKMAERQLQDFKWEVREGTASLDSNALAGTVMLIEPGADHGFLTTASGTQLYFHRDSVTRGRFEELRVGDAVHYVEDMGASGPVATKVRAV